MAKQIKHVYGTNSWTESNGYYTYFSHTIYTVPSNRIAKIFVDYIYNGWSSTSYSSPKYYSTSSQILIGGLYDITAGNYYDQSATRLEAYLYEANGIGWPVYQAFSYPNNVWRKPIEHAPILSSGQSISINQTFHSGTAYSKWNMLIIEEY